MSEAASIRIGNAQRGLNRYDALRWGALIGGGALAVLGNIDEIRLAVHANGRHHRILLSVDDAYVARGRVYDVDFILSGIHCQSGWAASHRDRGKNRQSAQVDHRHAIADAVGDVRVLVVIRAGFRRVLAACEQGKSEASRECKCSQLICRPWQPRAACAAPGRCGAARQQSAVFHASFHRIDLGRSIAPRQREHARGRGALPP